MLDRQRGALVGLAVGDALGAAVEFSPPGTFQRVTDYRAGGSFNLAAGEWTDDTSMALALADSIIEAGWDLNDQARRYLHWWREGEYSVNGRCFDIGMTGSRATPRSPPTSYPPGTAPSGHVCGSKQSAPSCRALFTTGLSPFSSGIVNCQPNRRLIWIGPFDSMLSVCRNVDKRTGFHFDNFVFEPKGGGPGDHAPPHRKNYRLRNCVWPSRSRKDPCAITPNSKRWYGPLQNNLLPLTPTIRYNAARVCGS